MSRRGQSMHAFAGDIIDEHALTSQPENTKDSVAVDQHHVALLLTNTSSLMPNSFYQRHNIPLCYQDIKLRAYVTNLNPVVIDDDTDADVNIDIEPVADPRLLLLPPLLLPHRFYRIHPSTPSHTISSEVVFVCNSQDG
ncbi:hypothetical protein PENDEC_c014G03541 [Penicillium decumbens]|uniref:Uncharacterized protein n=1 Tax=Penicillium decumbens TaxID=69771 RepID=A0A1V6P9X4_PENDC|nr:hypothetical protein PENDEC_c014G03541 [Penicillium decumbens]